jgi:hypothetical protein
MRYVFDIDGVICSHEELKYENAKPYYNMIGLINTLYDDGNEITLCTARGMKDYNIYYAYSKWYEVTKKQMDDWGVKYTRIIMGKPPGDFYIDDNGIRASGQDDINDLLDKIK